MQYGEGRGSFNQRDSLLTDKRSSIQRTVQSLKGDKRGLTAQRDHIGANACSSGERLVRTVTVCVSHERSTRGVSAAFQNFVWASVHKLI